MDRRMRGVLLLAAAGALWGFNGLYVQVLTQAGLGPLSIVFMRYLCALLALPPVVSALSGRAGRNVLALRPEQVACCAGMGLVSNAAGGVLSALAIARVGVSTTTVLLYTAPVFGCLLSRLLYDESLTRCKLAAIACNFLGVVLVVAGGGREVGLAPAGLAAGIAYGFTYALVAVFSRPLAGAAHPLAVVYYSSLGAAAALALPALGAGDLALVLHPLPLLMSLLYGCVSTVLAQILYQRGLASGVETSQVAVITSVEVAVSACAGVAVLGEPLALPKLAGIACVLMSIVLMNAHAAPGEVHGVHGLPQAGELQRALAHGERLAAATQSVRERRERFIARER